MRFKSLKVFAGVLMLGLLLGASSTAYADAFSLTSFGFNNLQFTPSVGTAQFTATSTTARADPESSAEFKSLTPRAAFLSLKPVPS